MKRIVYDVPKWHLWLHREARGLDPARPQDAAPVQLEDELFDRLYAGDPEPIRAAEPGAAGPSREHGLRTWAERVHRACEELPSFKRLAGECRGNAAAAATAVESLVRELGALADEPRRADGTQQEQRLRRRILTACAKASAAVDELRESASGLEEVLFGQIPGTGTATGAELPPSSVRALVTRLRQDSRLRRIALLAGRFKRIAAAKRRQRVKHGADELTDIGQGGELARLLPSELAKLARPALRRALLRDLLERQALQYQLSGTDTLGRGPLVLLLDKSGSMDGDRDLWATAVALALLAHAYEQRRPFALVAFDSCVKYEAVAKSGDPLPEQALLVGCAGGTDIALALARGLEIIRTNPGGIRKADVVLVTDGGSDASAAPALRDAARELGVTILGLGIGVSPEWLEPWCDDVEVISDLTTIDEGAAAKLFAAA